MIWIVGGDRPVESDAHRAIVEAMARGLRKGDGGAHLITFHPMGGTGSAQYFHESDWLDVNMRQNGHGAEYTGRYDQTRVDYDRTPVKPVLDGEPIYEDHPVSFEAKKYGHSIAADVRRPLYWDLFTGAMGHTYGHHSVWQMWTAAREPVNNPLLPWTDAIDQPGAVQMQHGRALLESRPFLTRVPDDTVIITGPVPTSMPGAGRYHFSATRDQDGSYAMVYAPVGPAVHRADGRHHRLAGDGVVVQPARRARHADRQLRQHRRARVQPAGPGRNAGLGAGAGRCEQELPAPGTVQGR